MQRPVAWHVVPGSQSVGSSRVPHVQSAQVAARQVPGSVGAQSAGEVQAHPPVSPREASGLGPASVDPASARGRQAGT